MSNFGDPKFEFHATNGIGAAALLRLANAEVLESAAAAFAVARDRALAARAQLSSARAKQVNAAFLQVERQLTRPQGLATRPWFRNLIYAADENNGYSNMALPSVGEAIRAGDEALTAREITDIAERFNAAARVLQMATGLLQTN